jgi:hypothetical protein
MQFFRNFRARDAVTEPLLERRGMKYRILSMS